MGLIPKRERFVQEARCFYVYELADPRDAKVFYVGKGKWNRLKQHVRSVLNGSEPNAGKALLITDILDSGHEVIECKVYTDLTEPEAFRKERETISHYGLSNLTNTTRGELSAMDKSKMQAQMILSRLKPRDAWMAEAQRSPRDIELADRVVAELSDIAQYGQVSEVLISANGVEFR